jgi:hypothetical protein
MRPPPRVPSGAELVRYGLETSRTCLGLATQVAPRFATDADDNGVPFSRAFGQRWYRNCSGSEEDYWADPERHDKRAAGLLASAQWRALRPFLDDPRQGPLLVLSLQQCRTKRNPGGASWFEAMRGKSYCIIRNETELFQFYRALPPADRFAEEIILPSTPHKAFFDIERDLDDPNMGEAEMIEHLGFLKGMVHAKFIPLLCEFYREKLGVALEERDCYVIDSSRLGAKFSVHITVSSPQHHYFATRTESWVAMLALMAMLCARSSVDEELRRWLFYRCHENKERCVWDFGIYGSGSRNMRLIGACKAKDRLVGTPWEQCRVFQPVPSQERAPYHHFIASAYGYADKERIAIPGALVREAADFALRLRPQRLHWFMNSQNFASRISKTALCSEEDRLYVRAAMGAGADRAAPARLAGDEGISEDVREADLPFARVMQGVRRGLGAAAPGLGELARQQHDDEAYVFRGFISAVSAHLEAVGAALHPGNNVRVEPNYVPGRGRSGGEHVAASAIMGAWVQGGRGAVRRRCWFGCTRGQHDVALRCRPDFSVEYFCFGCTRTAEVLRSPFRPGCVAPRDTSAPVPADFRGGLVDYALAPHAADEDAVHMRRIRCLSPGGDVLAGHSTAIMGGAMGTGKTVAVRAFLDQVRARHPDASVLAISFRKMLASMFAGAFGLTNYSEVEEHSLFDCRQLALQLESLERLGKQDEQSGDMGMYQGLRSITLNYNGRWDVVILDEVESVLAHFSSSTMKERLFAAWKLFFGVAKRCKALVVCDADIGPRTFQFLRLTRKIRGVIPGLQYHLNRHIAIRTRFVDYATVVDWKDALLASLLAGQRVFMFSNHKGFMHKLLGYLNRELRELLAARIAELGGPPEPPPPAAPEEGAEPPRRRRRLAAQRRALELDALAGDPRLTLLTEILGGVLLIDADLSESEKKTLANCNEEWVKYRMVMISPTVGAGIDFTRAHFDKAFGYATHTSCSARALNQMRGRCRKTLDGECHIVINDNVKYDLMTEDGRDGEARTAGLPVTLDDALLAVDINRRCYASDMSDVRDAMDANGAEIMTATVALIPPELKMTLALNEVEANRSRTCFRAEWVAVLQKGDPDLQYSFRRVVDLVRERRFAEELAAVETQHRATVTALVAAQADLSRSDFAEMRAKDMRGALDPAAPGASDYHLLRKNELKHFYGVRDDVPPAVWEHIYRVGAKAVGHVRNLAFVVGSSSNDLYLSAAHAGSLKSMCFRLLAEDGQMETINVMQRSAQEVWPGDHVVRLWTVKLMYVCGFHAAGGAGGPRAFAAEPAQLLSARAGGAEALEHVCMERLAEPGVQEWLGDRHMYLKKHSGGIKSTKVNAPEDGVWGWRHVTCLTAQFLRHWYGLLCRKAAPGRARCANASVTTEVASAEPAQEESLVRAIRHEEDPRAPGEEAAEEYTYSAPPEAGGRKMRKMRIDRGFLDTMLSLTYCHLCVPYQGRDEEPAIRVRAREQITNLMLDNGIALMIHRYVTVPTPAEVARLRGEAPAPVAPAAPAADAGGFGGNSDYGDYGGYGYGGGYEPAPGGLDPVREAGEAGEDTAEGPEEENPLAGPEAEDEEENPLASFETLEERDFKKRRACAMDLVKKAPDQQAHEDAYRARIIQRYTGASPFQLLPAEFVAEMLSGAYQGRVRRLCEELAEAERARWAAPARPADT